MIEIRDEAAAERRALTAERPLSTSVAHAFDRLWSRLEVTTIQRDAARNLVVELEAENAQLRGLLDSAQPNPDLTGREQQAWTATYEDVTGPESVDPGRQAEIRILFDAAPSLDALLAEA